jgi:hypothetical protein
MPNVMVECLTFLLFEHNREVLVLNIGLGDGLFRMNVLLIFLRFFGQMFERVMEL